MKIMVIGNGGREYGLVWAAKQSPQVSGIFVAPGSAGIAEMAKCFPVRADDLDQLVVLAQTEQADLVLIGPELPLTLGLSDRLQAAGIPAFGPSAAAARLEGSKAFAKDFLQRHDIPSARYHICECHAEALKALDEFDLPVVIKADGLAAGKGVTIALTRKEAQAAIRAAMEEEIFGSAGKRVVLEEFLAGEEASILAVTDGKTIIPLIAAQDHKRINDHDQGPNTGGMGAYAPAPVVTSAVLETVQKTILEPTLAGLAQEGIRYQGVLYAGLMINDQGPKVIEFNCRFGDPETQVVLPLLDTDLITIAQACIRGTLTPEQVKFKPAAAVCVVMAAPGYPGAYPKGKAIEGMEAVQAMPGIMIWHAGTDRKAGCWITSGGRVLNVIACAPTIALAVERVYQACDKIHFPGAHYRRDIAGRALNRDSAGVFLPPPGRKASL